MRRTILFVTFAITVNTFAQAPRLDRGVEFFAETTGILSDGTNAPFWLTSNEYGVPSVETNSIYLRMGAFRNAAADDSRRWDVGYGADALVGGNHTSTIAVNQLYADVRWLRGLLTVGQKQHPMQLKNGELSSGSQTFGINARPYPEVRLSLPDYWDIPGTRGALALKGHIAWGLLTDSKFQRSFACGLWDYDQDVLMHTKAGYLRIGKESKPLTAEIGLEMATQFGGTHFRRKGEAGGYEKVANGRGLSSFWHALIGGGNDAIDGNTPNNEGNMLGSWVARLNYDTKNARFGVYADHFFEDHSAMFMLDYDGYVFEDGKAVKRNNRYHLYDLKDIMLGADVHLKNFRWVTDAVVEYVYTKYQSGPVYTDRTPAIPDHIGGVDNYYNNALAPGWQHWGQAMGNPLYLSPIYNADGSLDFMCNRFVAWHFGIAGQPTERLRYRVRVSWQEGLGTYDMPYTDPKTNVSAAAEVTYRADKLYPGLSLKAAIGMDRGELRGDNTGGMLTVRLSK